MTDAPPPRLLPCGPRAVLAEYATLTEVVHRCDDLRRRIDVGDLDGVTEVVPAVRTVLVEVRARNVARRRSLGAHRTVPRAAALGPVPDTRVLEIAVEYDGADLHEVADRCGMRVDEVVAVHTAGDYVVAFCGFVPGFSYIVGLDPRLHLPRLPTPRPRVPAGSVAIASEFTAVYPDAVPGGWHLLGRTTARMWDEARPVAALAPPGARVRFVAR